MLEVNPFTCFDNLKIYLIHNNSKMSVDTNNDVDKKEIAITRMLHHLVCLPKVREKLARIRLILLSFYKRAIIRIYYKHNRDRTLNDFIEVSNEIFETASLYIVSSPKLNSFDFSKGIILISNHIGAYKLIKIVKKEMQHSLRNEINDVAFLDKMSPLINNDPIIILFSPVIVSFMKIVDNLDVDFYLALSNSSFPYSDVIQDCNGFEIRRDVGGQYAKFEHEIDIRRKNSLERGKIPVIVLFPEGGTSGKRRMDGPLMLGDFMRGYLYYSKKYGLPILPVLQFFDDLFNYRISYLKPITKINDINVDNRKIRIQMQGQLNRMTNLGLRFK